MSRQLGEVKVLASDMEPEEVRGGIECPACRGGVSHEKSLSITRRIDGALFICHRNKCNFKGFVPMIASVRDMKAQRDWNNIPDGAKKYYGKLEALPEGVIATLLTKYNLSVEDIAWAQWKWAPDMDGGRLAIPLISRFGYTTGHTFRSLNKKVVPKARNIITANSEPLLCWYKHSAESLSSYDFTKPVVLVEDCISALRIRRFVNAVSLMGTNLNSEKVTELRKCSAPAYLLALDEDATGTAARYLNQFGELLKGMKMVALKYDLKDSSDEIIREALFL